MFEAIIVANWMASLFPLFALGRAGVSCDNAFSAWSIGDLKEVTYDLYDDLSSRSCGGGGWTDRTGWWTFYFQVSLIGEPRRA